jgi:hypothetical protein
MKLLGNFENKPNECRTYDSDHLPRTETTITKNV